MGAESKIEWTEATWNPLRGCTEISPGCVNCYAAAIAYRFSGPGQPYEGLAYKDANGRCHWTGKLRMVPEKLDEPLRWRKPRQIFVNSMTDLFHEDVTNEYIAAVFGVMAMAPRHTFQILTKRPERMAEWFKWLKAEYDGPCDQNAVLQTSLGPYLGDGFDEAFEDMLDCDWPLPNVWLGTSVEDQQRADERIPHLLQVPAAVRFLSMEPLLGPVDLQRFLPIYTHKGPPCCIEQEGWHRTKRDCGIGWIIVGGESGPKARPMHPDWARSIRDQCVAAGVPFHFKQWGEWFPLDQEIVRFEVGHCPDFSKNRRALFPDGHHLPDLTGRGTNGDEATVIVRVGKHAAGRMLDGRTWDELPITAEVA